MSETLKNFISKPIGIQSSSIKHFENVASNLTFKILLSTSNIGTNKVHSIEMHVSTTILRTEISVSLRYAVHRSYHEDKWIDQKMQHLRYQTGCTLGILILVSVAFFLISLIFYLFIISLSSLHITFLRIHIYLKTL